MTSQTMTEKILSRAMGSNVFSGDEIQVGADYMIAYDFPGYTDKMFRQMYDDFGMRSLEEPERYVVFMDHMVTQGSEKEKEIHAVTKEWTDYYGIQAYEAEGIGHQLTVELGFAKPGKFLIHFDGHISGVGGVNALGWGVRRDLIEGWVTGKVSVTVPESILIELKGTLPEHVDSRDLLHSIIRDLGADGCAHKVIEFTGPGAESLSQDQKQNLCGMAMFTGAVSAIFAPDDTLWSGNENFAREDAVHPDVESESYVNRHVIDLSELEPLVVKPGSARAENTVTEASLRSTPITQAFIGSCVSGRIDDIRTAANILEGRTIAEGVKLNIVPSSRMIFEEAERLGYVGTLQAAGAVIAKSSCDFCFGYEKPLSAEDVSISTGVLNISGRMGSPHSKVYMGSAATVAESAVQGQIASPRKTTAHV